MCPILNKNRNIITKLCCKIPVHPFKHIHLDVPSDLVMIQYLMYLCGVYPEDEHCSKSLPCHSR